MDERACLLVSDFIQYRGKVLTFGKLGCIINLAHLVDAKLVERQDIWMLQPSQDLGFRDKARDIFLECLFARRGCLHEYHPPKIDVVRLKILRPVISWNACAELILVSGEKLLCRG